MYKNDIKVWLKHIFGHNKTFQREIEVNCQNTPKTIVNEESKVVSLKEEIKETSRTFELDRDSNREIDLSETFINIVSIFPIYLVEVHSKYLDSKRMEVLVFNDFKITYLLEVVFWTSPKELNCIW